MAVRSLVASVEARSGTLLSAAGRSLVCSIGGGVRECRGAVAADDRGCLLDGHRRAVRTRNSRAVARCGVASARRSAMDAHDGTGETRAARATAVAAALNRRVSEFWHD